MTTPFTSIRYPLAIDEGLGRLETEPDYAEHVEQLIRQVLLTGPGERINRPGFGCGLRRMVFAPNSDVAAALAQVSVFQALTEWLSSAIVVHEVRVQALGDKLEVRVVYALKARQERRYLNLEVTV